MINDFYFVLFLKSSNQMVYIRMLYVLKTESFKRYKKDAKRIKLISSFQQHTKLISHDNEPMASSLRKTTRVMYYSFFFLKKVLLKCSSPDEKLKKFMVGEIKKVADPWFTPYGHHTLREPDNFHFSFPMCTRHSHELRFCFFVNSFGVCVENNRPGHIGFVLTSI